jgi:hypothetical protein
MWRTLTKAQLTERAPDSPLHLVTLSAVTETDCLNGTLRDMTVSVHSLFRRIVGTPTPEWIGAETCGKLHKDGHSLEWTWHILLTTEQLERSRASEGGGTPTSQGCAA